MQEVFKKIIDKLEEMIHPKQLYFCKYARGGCKHLDNDYKDCMECVVENAIEIVKQEAEKYNNGWIPCNKELPTGYCNCLVTRINEYEDGFDTDVREDTYVEIEGVWDWQSKHEGLIDKVIAWQPLPEAYKKNGETYE